MGNYLIESIFPSQFYGVIPYGILYFSTQFNNKYPRHTARMKKNWMGFVTFVTSTMFYGYKNLYRFVRARSGEICDASDH